MFLCWLNQLPCWSLYFGSGIFSSILFWCVVLFFEYCERTGFLDSFHIQKDNYCSQEMLRKARNLVRFNQISIQLPSLFLYYFLYQWLGMQFYESPPNWYIILLQLVAFMFIEDTLFYWSHRTLHHKALFERFHKIHHDFHVSSAVASQYVHPVEYIASGIIPTLSAPLIIMLLGWPVHILTFALWLWLRVLAAINEHCGYELPFLLPHKLMFINSATEHDRHHSDYGNYGSFFRHWDILLNTSYQPSQNAVEKNF